MAPSPVVINSSSPPPFRLPSETPPQPAHPAESSSPGLPSPSSFFPKPAAGLRAKVSPRSNVSGTVKAFTSAARLLKSNYFQDDATLDKSLVSAKPHVTKVAPEACDGFGVSNSGRKTPKVAGAGRASSAKVSAGAIGRSPLQSFAGGSPSRRARDGQSPVRGTFALAVSPTKKARQRSRTPSVSLSVYSFDGGIQEDSSESPADRTVAKANAVGNIGDSTSAPEHQDHVPLGPVETTKQPRKRSGKGGEATAAQTKKSQSKRDSKPRSGADAPNRQPRKPLAKSASFVLNSDDLVATQFADLDAAQIQGSKHPQLKTSEHESAPAKKPKRAPSRPKKGARPNADSDTRPAKRTNSTTGNESTYFAKPPTAADDSAIELGVPVTISRLSEEPADLPVQSHRRRRSWTPAKDTLSLSRHSEHTPTSMTTGDQEVPTLSLTAILGDLAYSRKDVAPLKRSTSGEAPLKRRKIDLAEEATVASRAKTDLKPAKEAPMEKREKTKKIKAPKKKAQTITELATKAYRPEDSPQIAQATVSSFFAASDAGAAMVAPADPACELAAPPKKPRRPRSKKAEGGARPIESQKKAVKPKAKVKVRFNEDDLYPELYAPERARLEEGRQNFLFGTSSQLGTEDSPTFIRQMQFALQESEAAAAEVDAESPLRRSFVRIPTAPHGTSLSCGQAMRELWHSAARSFEDDLLPSEARPATTSTADDMTKAVDYHSATSFKAEVRLEQVANGVSGRSDPALPQTDDSGSGKGTHQIQHEVVDLCCTSPLDPPNPAHLRGERSQHEPGIGTTCTDTTKMLAVVDSAALASHEWKVLGSSPESPRSKKRPTEAPILKLSPQLKRTATSPLRDRAALQALDVNTSPRKAFLNTTMTKTEDQRQKRPRGRPRKDMHGVDGSQTAGCPARKRLETVNTLTLGQGRRKETHSASQPISSSDFVNIDEISDPDALVTPSPPRRRATSSPPTARPLDLKVIASPSIGARTKSQVSEPKDTDKAAASRSKLKPEDATWTSVTLQLFPQITATIKSTAPSGDLANPTWYEKILLYDPIVLEDLTAWLNDRGLRVQTRRLKANAKVKGRKKKQDELAIDQDGPTTTEDEYELFQEPLKPWMVQKWCEDKSVCCLWKEGLRGDVRTRY
ncbi:hypothetical protein CERZMDRAFT_92824 [Cercospora zeae-maydis SCOH1-5]|uniref:Structure-specific endonuclease subunit SLX4 n=1 Tax=Cercospora zeae-maydis SCOH1-5 TaxID=717836 RepID=A0A6A6FTD5_9PEZI|nr:hypothetical protein CERZMDRAFT_92824 [Cercospora zeae-maydis SCOH1-5]